MNHTMWTPSRSGLLAVLLAGVMTAAAPAMAQQEGNAGNGGGADAAKAQSSAQPANPRAELRELQKQLGEIRDQALENNPELKEQRQSLKDAVNARMADEGVDPETDVERLRELAEKLRSGEVKGEEQKTLTKEYREKRQALLTARRKALGDEEIQKQRKAFEDDLRAAMIEQNPETEALISKYRKQRTQMRQKMQKAIQQRQKQQQQQKPSMQQEGGSE
ncbi:hypothetical protein [Arhodomonas sp. AD133]|uniref:hypothetical protein n=1 Tax=Arhodomonas sp. AD133 TaxID=3415009 RepID=UPI003EB6C33F